MHVYFIGLEKTNTPRVTVGSKVKVKNIDCNGIIMFIGKTAFGTSQNIYWYGIKLDEPNGNNNGTIDGRKYFECKDKHGIFVKKDEFEIIDPLSIITGVNVNSVNKDNQVMYVNLFFLFCLLLNNNRSVNYTIYTVCFFII